MNLLLVGSSNSLFGAHRCGALASVAKQTRLAAFRSWGVAVFRDRLPSSVAHRLSAVCQHQTSLVGVSQPAG